MNADNFTAFNKGALMKKIEEKLLAVYEFVESYIDDNGFPPSVREIQSKLKIKSTATVYDYLERLKSRGLISKSPAKNRAISLGKRADRSEDAQRPDMIPVVGRVAAGTPIFAVENLDGYCPLPEEFGDPSDKFALKVSGNSMINAGIYNGDTIIVRKQNAADDGQIIVALVDDSATVKRLFRRDGKIILHPENDEMSDMIFDEVSVLGIVKGLIRKF